MNQPAPETQPILRAYILHVSNGPAIQCDADELPKIVMAIKTGVPCVLRAGMFNPSYWQSTTEDHERINEVRRQNEAIRQQNEFDIRMNGGKNQQAYKGLQPIKDIFEGMNLKAGSNFQTPRLPEEIGLPKVAARRDGNKEEGFYMPVPPKKK